VAEALTLCRERRIRHIPILDEGQLVGIVSDRDLRDASPALGDAERASALQEIRVGDVMTREVSTADPQDSIGNVTQEMYELKIGSLPVVAEEELLGIVTSSDVMRALVTLAGLPDMIKDLLIEAAETGDVRDDVAPEELASYCLHALAAASSLRSKAAVRRLVMVTLAGLRSPR
jgi:CBS domain-containing protein